MKPDKIGTQGAGLMTRKRKRLRGTVAKVIKSSHPSQPEKAEMDIRLIEERWRLAAQAGKMYAYDWDVATDIVLRSGEVASVVGREVSVLTREQVLARVHPDDRALFAASATELTPDNPDTQISYRVLDPDGSVKWLGKTARAYFDGNGRMVRMIGMVTDITESKLGEEKLREYERAVEYVEEFISVFDREYRCIMTNRAYLSRRKLAREQVVGHFAREFVDEEIYETVIRPKLDECFQGKVVKYELRYTYPEIGERDLLAAYYPIEGRNGVDRIVCVLHDITDRKMAEASLRESEERFRVVADTAPVMIWMSSTDKQPNYFNQAWLDFTGRSFEAELQSGLAAITHPDDFDRCRKIYIEAFDSRRPFKKECRLRRHDGEYRWVLDTGVPRFLADGSFVGYIGSCIDVTDHKLAEEALSNVNRQLIEAHEQERTRIARELHDDINQRIALLCVQLETAKQGLPASAVQASNRIKEALECISNLGNDIQELSHRLHSSKLEFLGLETASAGFCREVSTRQKVEIDFHSENVPKNLPNEVSLCLFRVLQEALQNASKHSGSRCLEVLLSGKRGNEIELTVHDKGIGFEPEEAIKGRGLGLANMRERLRLVDGQLSIQSKPHQGTTIHAHVPLSHSMATPR